MRKTNRYLFLLFLFFLPSCFAKRAPLGQGREEWGINVTWHGHSCFTLEDSLGRTVVIDPFDETVGYGYLRLRADALLITHPHFDHNAKRRVKARRSDIDLASSTGTIKVAGDMTVTGISSFHDNEKGQVHGDNIIFVFSMGGLRIAHLGDLGQKKLTAYQRSVLGSVDVLFVPIGGFTTLDPKEAKKIVDDVSPGFVFPMHYGDIRFYKLAKVESFLKLFKAGQIQTLEKSTIRIKKGQIGKIPKVITLVPTERNK